MAIKVLHGDAAADPDLRGRFGREAAAARRVASFCTAAVIGAELDGARPYIVSEFVEGVSLRTAVAGGRRFAGADLHRLGTAVATALTAVHEAGVIHRDMKPDNVLIGPDGPRVIDFGIARTLEMSLTATGMVAGTPTYMAPEVFTGQRAGPPADVFAWGGIMLFAATGEDPFEAESLGSVMHRVLTSDPDLTPLPVSMRSLVGAALAKDPRDRPASRELLLALVSDDGRSGTAALLAEGSREAGLIRGDRDDPALGARAEEIYARLGQEQRALAPAVFLRLVTLDEDGEVRPRRARRDEFPEAGREILGAFSRLLTGDEREIWPASPALPHAWPRLRAWARNNRDGLAVHREVWTALRRWEQGGRKESGLLSGAVLADARRWAAAERGDIVPSDAERAFLDAGAALARRRARRGRVLTGSLGGLLVAALVAGGLAIQQSGLAEERGATAESQATRAESQRIAALADTLRATDPVKAMLLSVAAWRITPTPQTRAAVAGSLAQHEHRAFHDPATASGTIRALSHDSRTLVSVGENTVRVWDVRTGTQVGGFAGVGARVRSAAVSPAGRTLAVVDGTRVDVWDLRTGKRRAQLPLDTPAYARVPRAVAFGQAENILIVGGEGPLDSGQKQVLWDLTTGRKRTPPFHVAQISPDGKHMVGHSESHALETWRPVDGKRGDFGAMSRDAAYSADSRFAAVAVGSAIHFKTVRDEKDYCDRLIADYDQGTVQMSPDGRHVVSYTADTITVWSDCVLSPSLVHKIDTVEPVVAFDPDGHTMRYLDGAKVVTLDLRRTLAPARLKGTSDNLVLSPDSRLLATHADETAKVTLWDVRRRTPIGTLDLGRAAAFSILTFSADGRRLAAATEGNSPYTLKVDVWDTSTLKRVATLTPRRHLGARTLTLSADGGLLAMAVDETDKNPHGAVQLWDLSSGSLRWERRQRRTSGLTFAPGGKSLAIAGNSWSGLVDLVSGRKTGKDFGAVLGDSRAATLAFDKGGTRFALGTLAGYDDEGRSPVGEVSLWDTATQRRLDTRLAGQFVEGVSGVIFSPRGDVVAAVVERQKVMMWEAGSGIPLGGPFSVHPEYIAAMAFNADGTHLVTVGAGGDIAEHVVDPEQSAAAVCARAGKTLSAADWKAFKIGVPYRDVCPRSGD
ncbi:hypothetical protein Ssi02_54450 [Sinosporangium siamense]|uniref:Protein kinase domain-containing protein n=1 Tax=Sinosporangium siamense TaxID=1367973 RepID=A0A919RNG1_9ACTN|nr:hypothetical protein Ssi02_54450 [Sinosporangium siamense]